MLKMFIVCGVIAVGALSVYGHRILECAVNVRTKGELT